jgi:hypothetical protein
MIKSMAYPDLADGLPSPGYAEISNPAHNPPVAAPTYESPPQGVKSQPAILRGRSSFQMTPVRSSLECTPGNSPVLDPAKQAELDAKIAAELARFENKCREITDIISAADRKVAIDKEKIGHASRMSKIRQKYGIQIRKSKLRPANFVRIQGDAPILAPMSSTAAFRTPPAKVTSIDTPDPKRRKLEDSSSCEQNPNFQKRLDPYGVPGGLQRRMSAQSLKVLKPNQGTPAEFQTTLFPKQQRLVSDIPHITRTSTETASLSASQAAQLAVQHTSSWNAMKFLGVMLNNEQSRCLRQSIGDSSGNSSLNTTNKY